jgi:antagonist of KipI
VSSIRVVSPGFLTTIQDLGRYGHAHRGISASGAADALGLRAGNLLVGNAENAPAIEMTLTGGEFEFESDAIVALAGSDFDAELPLWMPIEIKAGAVLRCRGTKSGARCYLAVRGGIDAPLTLASASAHLLTGVGGRTLRKGDVLAIGESAVRKPRPPAKNPPQSERSATVRVTDGPQSGWFSGQLYEAPYTVAEECNRMGIRLTGTPIPSPAGGMLTEGVALGAIQVPPDGQPIVLFVEHQTTGGYPKPANVISADFWRLGQMRPRDEVRFEKVSIPHALDLLQAQERWLYTL